MAKSLVRAAARAVTPRNYSGNPFSYSKYNSGNGLWGSGPSDRFSQLSAMGTQGTLFSIIQLLSTGAQATGGWKMYQKPKDGRVRYARPDQGSDMRKEIVQHQALRLWNQPNDFMTGPEFREIGWQFMELVGEWYWVLNRGPSGTGIPIEMWPVRPDRMEPVPDRDKFLAGWVYTGPDGEAVPLSTDEVIQLRYPNPTDPYRGLSAVQACLSDIDASKYTAQWTRNFFLNSAQPGGIVTFGKRLTDDEFNEFTARWREQHQGVARGHRVGVLEQGATWQPNNWTVKDMDMTALRSMTNDQIRQSYRIHPGMLGISEDVNRANAETAEEVHISWHEVPRLERQKNTLNHKLLSMFADEDVYEFDYNDPKTPAAEYANEELTTKTAALAVLVTAGFDPDEACDVVGLPHMKWKNPKPPPPKLAAPAARPALAPGAKPNEPGQEPNPANQIPQELLDDRLFDMDLAAVLREAFDKAKSNGHRKETVYEP